MEREPNLAKAIERTQATGSSRFEISALGSEDGEKVDWTCAGAADYARKRFRLECEGLAPDEAVEIDPVSDFSPEKLLALLRAASQETERVGEEDIRGESTVRYRLTVRCEDTQLSCPDETAPVEVWIDRDGLVRRIRVEDDEALNTIEFFDFGVEVEVEPHPADEVTESGEGWTGYGPLENEPGCSDEAAAPIGEDQAMKTLRRNGFSVSRDENACFGNVAAALANPPDVFEQEGHVSCFVFVEPPPDAPKTVVRRGADGADAELLLENLDCMQAAHLLFLGHVVFHVPPGDRPWPGRVGGDVHLVEPHLRQEV